jgi:hypothetical protein
MTERAYQVYQDLKVNVAEEAMRNGPTAAASRFLVTVDTAVYYLKKLTIPGFHGGDWGGARNIKFDEVDQENFDVRRIFDLAPAGSDSLVLCSWCCLRSCAPTRFAR